MFAVALTIDSVCSFDEVECTFYESTCLSDGAVAEAMAVTA